MGLERTRVVSRQTCLTEVGLPPPARISYLQLKLREKFHAPKVPPKFGCRPRNSYADLRRERREIPSQTPLRASD